MRALCDVCESAPAHLFCAADEAALCLKCDDKVHGCNKVASRHVRLELAETRAVPKCDICENAPAFFFCSIDGTSLCLQCDMDVHIGGKKMHQRYLMMGQRVEWKGGQKRIRHNGAMAMDHKSEDGSQMLDLNLKPPQRSRRRILKNEECIAGVGVGVVPLVTNEEDNISSCS